MTYKYWLVKSGQKDCMMTYKKYLLETDKIVAAMPEKMQTQMAEVLYKYRFTHYGD